MALSAKWLDGDLIFYDGAQEVYRIKNSTDGVIVGESDAEVPVALYGGITNQAPNTVATTGGVPTLTLAITDNRFQFIDTTGARSVVLPSATGATAIGIQYFIARGSTSTGVISVYDGSTASGDLVAEIAQYESGILVNDGVQWKGIVGTAT